MKICTLFALLAISSTAGALVIRDDVDDRKYQVPASTFPALADFPGEGHGVLIAPQWVVTAAHVVASQHVMEITIGGASRAVGRVVIHPGYKTLPGALVDEALASGDGAKIAEFLATSDDIALVKLRSSVDDVKPAVLFRGDDEIGQNVQLLGKGASASGIDGESPHLSHRTLLRRAYNVISDADARWIRYTFDAPGTALPLEGMTGSGDSGGPVLIRKNRQWQLAGLASWRYARGDLLHPGRYGDDGNNVRISRYVAWIESVTSGGEKAD
ncbi:MAG TPA: trypsin-like serine protease [Tahibacter sp.]|jgi:hypothetical protein|nr:trypsin-like serine protease [Tahibacter sp.]HVJ62226.1 trypsin-like serine protease [Tahibacter sp.]